MQACSSSEALVLPARCRCPARRTGSEQPRWRAPVSYSRRLFTAPSPGPHRHSHQRLHRSSWDAGSGQMQPGQRRTRVLNNGSSGSALVVFVNIAVLAPAPVRSRRRCLELGRESCQCRLARCCLEGGADAHARSTTRSAARPPKPAGAQAGSPPLHEVRGPRQRSQCRGVCCVQPASRSRVRTRWPGGSPRTAAPCREVCRVTSPARPSGVRAARPGHPPAAPQPAA